MTKIGRSKPRYSEEIKKGIIKKILDGQFTISEASRHYQICSKTLYRWVDLFTNGNNSISLDKQSIQLMEDGKHDSKSESELLKKRIEALEKSLANERLRSQAFLKMIKIAEEKYSISIEKKSGSKQSKK